MSGLIPKAVISVPFSDSCLASGITTVSFSDKYI